MIAPDLPGFGFTEAPDQRHYQYTFDSLAGTVFAFTEALSLTRYALYVFDYGAPTAFRLAMAPPDRITAIVSQNGNAYEAWAPIRRYWSQPTEENRDAIRRALNPDGIRREYTSGIPNPELIAPGGRGVDQRCPHSGGTVFHLPGVSLGARDMLPGVHLHRPDD